jgi:GT2 family glycosyltransferase
MRSRTVVQRPGHDEHTFRPTRILSVELSRELHDLTGLTQYGHAAVLVRYHGAPLGCVLIPCEGNVIESPRLRDAIFGDTEICRRLTVARLQCYFRPDDAVAPSALTWSVVVCTRDRVHHLKRCLDRLTGEQSPQGQIVVVDNDPPSSATRELVAAYPHVRYIVEPRRGLNAARAAGLAAATGDIVIYTDDDVIIDANWIGAMLEPFSHSRVGAVTGLTMPYELETPAQALFEYYGGHSRGYRRQVFDLGSMPAAGAGKVGSGANMAFRKSVAVALHLFEPELDMGTVTLTGGDAHAFYLVIRHGYQIVYTPDALVWHVHRREYEALRNMLGAYSCGGMAHLTRCLVRYRDPEALRVAWWWLTRDHLRPLYRALRRQPDAMPLDLVLAQLAGFVRGPLAYFRAKRIEDARPVGPAHPVPLAEPAPETPAAKTPAAGPVCAVIIPSYNRCHTLQRVLEALRTQTVDMRHVDVVVVLDGSTDASEAMLRDWVERSKLPRLTWLRQEQAGQAAARTRGAQETAAPVLVFLDDDVVPEPDLLAAHLKHHRDGRSVVVLGNARIVRSRPHELYETITWSWWEDLIDERGRAGRPPSYRDFCAGNVSLRRDDFRGVGGFDRDFKGYGGEDYELGYRLIGAGIPFVVEPEASARHHHRSSLQHILRNARHEGRNDVVLGRKHPELKCGLGVGRPWGGAPLSFRVPRFGAIAAWMYANVTRVLAACGFQHSARGMLARVRQHAYWCGVRDALGTWDAVRAYQARQPPPATFTWDLDTRESISIRSIPADTASEIVIRFRTEILGQLRLVPPIFEAVQRVPEEMVRQLGPALNEAMRELPGS